MNEMSVKEVVCMNCKNAFKVPFYKSVDVNLLKPRMYLTVDLLRGGLNEFKCPRCEKRVLVNEKVLFNFGKEKVSNYPNNSKLLKRVRNFVEQRSK